MVYQVFSRHDDVRLERVEQLLLSRLVSKKTVCLKKLAGKRSDEVKFGRFLRNKKVSPQPMIADEQSRTNRASSDKHVLSIMDTTEINFQHHADKVQGLGTVGNGKDKGIFLHPALVIDADSGAGLGFSSIHYWNRFKKKAKNYPSLPVEEKESYRWIDTAQKSKTALTSAAYVTFVADRESDMYELFDRIPDKNTGLLIRACRNRRLNTEHTLFSYADALEIKDEQTIKIRNRLTERTRCATLNLSYEAVTLRKPGGCSDKNAKPGVNVNLIYVRETDSHKNSKKICWRLLTTHAIKNSADAWKIVDWYRQRWQIEQLFRTLKTQGLNIESAQVESSKSIETLLIMAIKAAFNIMQLVLARDGLTGQKTTDVFTEQEIIFLEVLKKQYEGNTIKQKNPYPKKNLAWAAWVIARLGGWKGYKSERPPGPITMRNGLEYFNAMFSGWILAKDVCIP